MNSPPTSSVNDDTEGRERDTTNAEAEVEVEEKTSLVSELGRPSRPAGPQIIRGRGGTGGRLDMLSKHTRVIRTRCTKRENPGPLAQGSGGSGPSVPQTVQHWFLEGRGEVNIDASVRADLTPNQSSKTPAAHPPQAAPGSLGHIGHAKHLIKESCQGHRPYLDGALPDGPVHRPAHGRPQGTRTILVPLPTTRGTR
jgi:hypothetical protein